jgi:DNA-binding Lrp family transcriptional regulator
MRRRLDSLDIQLLEALGIYGPRSISNLARKMGVPAPTIRDRLQTLKSHFSLLLQAKVYHTFIGLKKAFVFARATPGYEKLLWEAMKTNGYWLFLTARYDSPESFYGIYSIPIEHVDEFEQLVRQMKELKIAQSADLFWSTCIHEVNLTGSWYNHESKRWIFKWNEWVESIESQGTSLPPTLKESKSYPQKADETDIIILKELQKNAECKLTNMARLMGLSPQIVRYHFENHVVEKGLIEGYSAFLPHFEMASESYCFKLHFYDEKNMAKCARSFEDKPFVRSLGKIFGDDALLVHIYLPREEFRGLTDSLTKLVRKGVMRSYDYVVEDINRKQGQTIPYKFFKDKSWIYNHNEYIEELRRISAQIGQKRQG